MLFTPLDLHGAYQIEPEPRNDHRGFFARVFCQDEFKSHGLNTVFVQCNISLNQRAGTLRGMHYQAAPFAEAKLIRCTRGRVFDVMIDLRRDAPTLGKWYGTELSADNHRMMYVPEGFAHGYQTLEPDTEVFYMASAFYSPKHEYGIRWDDPAFSVRWPLDQPILSPKDAVHPDYSL